MEKKDIKWSELGFGYIKTDKRYYSYWKDGKWDDGQLSDDNKVHISEGSTCLHYGQECFEGLKAYSTKDGGIQLFRPDENAKRMQKSCERLLMPIVPVEKFIDACMQVVKANAAWVPPYGSGATLYGANSCGYGLAISDPCSWFFIYFIDFGDKTKLHPLIAGFSFDFSFILICFFI
jgi:branched-chain amino acid aminotransferase